MSKPIKAKPSFYARCYFNLKEIALTFGYNLVLHGSLDRDLDLIAIPWVDAPGDELEMIREFEMYLTGRIHVGGAEQYMFSVLPGGRNSYVINLNRGGRFNNYVDEEWYLDISVTPIIKP